MRLQLPKLQWEDQVVREIRKKNLKESWEELKEVLHYKGRLYLPEIIRTEIMNKNHNNPLVGHYGVEKTKELVVQKYYWLTLQADIETYLKGCDLCISSKAIGHKFYSDSQSLSVPTHDWNDLSMDYITGLPVSTNWKGKNFDSILVIVDLLTKMNQ